MKLLILTSRFNGEEIEIGRLNFNMQKLSVDDKGNFRLKRDNGMTAILKKDTLNTYIVTTKIGMSFMIFDYGFIVDTKKAKQEFLKKAVKGISHAMNRLKTDYERVGKMHEMVTQQLKEFIEDESNKVQRID